MTTLPSFVELMASLGLENKPQASPRSLASEPCLRSRSSSCSSSISSPRQGPIVTISRHPHKSQSIPSFRDLDPERRVTAPRRVTRYSPYSSGISGRRGSLPSGSLTSSDAFEGPIRSSSTSPDMLSPNRTAMRRNGVGRADTLSVSTSTPISTYVRRKTPHTSPTSPTFPQRSYYDVSGVPSIPVLPTLLPQSPSSFTFPPTERDRPGSSRSSPMLTSNLLPEISEVEPLSRRSLLQTGVRISAAPRSEPADSHHRHFISPIA